MEGDEEATCQWCGEHYCVCSRPEVITPIGREDRAPDIWIAVQVEG